MVSECSRQSHQCIQGRWRCIYTGGISGAIDASGSAVLLGNQLPNEGSVSVFQLIIGTILKIRNGPSGSLYSRYRSLMSWISIQGCNMTILNATSKPWFTVRFRSHEPVWKRVIVDVWYSTPFLRGVITPLSTRCTTGGRVHPLIAYI